MRPSRSSVQGVRLYGAVRWWTVWSVTALLLLLLSGVTDGTNFTVGYLTNLRGINKAQGLSISGALTIAIQKVNDDPNMLVGHHLNFVWNDTNSDRKLVIRSLTNQWKDGAIAFFGPEDICDVEAHIADAWNLPMISYKCTDSKVSDKAIFSTFVRTFPPDKQVTKSVIALLKYHGWKKFTIVHDDSNRWTTVAQACVKEAINKNFTVNQHYKFTPPSECCLQRLTCCEPTAFATVVDKTYLNTRIYIFLGETNDLVKFMRALANKELLENGEYIVIYVDLEEYIVKQSHRYYMESSDLNTDTLSSTKDIYEIAESLLVVAPTPPMNQNYNNFEDGVRNATASAPFDFIDTKDFAIKGLKRHVSVYAAYLHDSVMLYAEALDMVLKSNGSERNGTAIIRGIIDKKKFESITGVSVKIDENGDAEGNFSVLALTVGDFNLMSVTLLKTMRPVGMFIDVDRYPQFKLLPQKTIAWKGGKPPEDEPPCGFDGGKCRPPPDKNREIASGVLGGLLVVVLASAIILYRNWKYEQEIAGLLWKINLKEIQPRNNCLLNSASKASLASQVSMESRVWGQIFTTAGSYKGTMVAIKTLFFRKKIADIPRETKIEMKIMREIRHDNINPFIGSCLEPHQIYIVTEYCSKGSLLDILENDDIKLDPLVIASLVWDLIKGMIYLHDSDLKVHGNLKSSNCVISSRWVLQVVDFGLHDLRHQAEHSDKGEYQQFWSQLWTAPEILRDPGAHVKGTQKGDIYSFAIILFEIFGREGPYPRSQVHDLVPRDVIEKVKHSDNGELFRPDVHILVCQGYIIDCMKDCWQEDPDLRPDFRVIRDRLKTMRQGLKTNIFDHMMDVMEKYATNLEEVVEERTALLVEEKKKTEALLHRMLPPPVAMSLMRGEYVTPETFDAVTIYFSDIVGFTEMSASSTPMEVVTFLNELYTVFDNAISSYDVYKVETIGDAYMCVSGLPIRNGNKHAGEIASMALELLASIKSFRIPHRPDETLKLRIGIHTGPVVSGVVGKTMPRYCLFGDTVNTSSRMESTGEALKIHISEDCKKSLDKLTGYVVEERGAMHIKGKGKMTTYWLTSQDASAVQRKETREAEMAPFFGNRLHVADQQPDAINRNAYSRCSISSRVNNLNSRSIQEFADKSQASRRSHNYSPVRTRSFMKRESRRESDLSTNSDLHTVRTVSGDDAGGSGETLPADEQSANAAADKANKHSSLMAETIDEGDNSSAEYSDKLVNNNILNGDPHPVGPSDGGTGDYNLINGNAVIIAEHPPALPSDGVLSRVENLVTSGVADRLHRNDVAFNESSVSSPCGDEMTLLLVRNNSVIDGIPSKEVKKRWRSCDEINSPKGRQKSLKTWFTGLFRDGITVSASQDVPAIELLTSLNSNNVEGIV